jgi:uncharacterized membrane protein
MIRIAVAPPVRRAALIGAATGSRSVTGLAALALSARSGWLAHRPVQLAIAAGAVAELVIDQLPMTPSRLQARGLISRVVMGGLCGALVARRDQTPIRIDELALSVGVGATAALKMAALGAGARSISNRTLGRDWPGAVIEDLIAAGLAAGAVRPIG